MKPAAGLCLPDRHCCCARRNSTLTSCQSGRPYCVRVRRPVIASRRLVECISSSAICRPTPFSWLLDNAPVTNICMSRKRESGPSSDCIISSDVSRLTNHSKHRWSWFTQMKSTFSQQHAYESMKGVEREEGREQGRELGREEYFVFCPHVDQ